MPPTALVTLPGAPVALPAVTSGLDTVPPALARLRAAVDRVLEEVPDGRYVVVGPATHLAVWDAGDLTLAGFGLADPSNVMWRGDGAADVASRLGVATVGEPIPTEARVVARLIGPDRVAAIVGLPPDAPAAAASLLELEDSIVALVGDLSASVGPQSPRPGGEPRLDDLIENRRLVPSALRQHVDGIDPILTAALQVACAPSAPPLVGEVHVVRGVATLLGTSESLARRTAS
ncbi:MAG: hypothetical protein R3249_06725 [Nitriliruptorales bacterium]|nr:hypothetical protein [Nitriliruptorales bacterium]